LVLVNEPLSVLVFPQLEKPLVVVGIPAHNEEKTIARVVLEARKYAHFVVVCDDGSDDRTAIIAENSGAYVVKHRKNIGYGAAIKSLFEAAIQFEADALVTIDGDGQHDAREIPSITKAIFDGCADVVIGSRFIRSQGTAEMPFYRRLGIRVLTKLVNSSAKIRIKDSQSGFRAYNRRALTMLELTRTGMDASIEILFDANKKNLTVTEIPSRCIYHTGNPTSTHNPIRQGLGLILCLIWLKSRNITKNTAFRILPFFLVGCSLDIWLAQTNRNPDITAVATALASVTFPLVGFALIRLLNSQMSNSSAKKAR
jgi:glycosyltransferase involved in cell wall biosynthesis